MSINISYMRDKFLTITLNMSSMVQCLWQQGMSSLIPFSTPIFLVFVSSLSLVFIVKRFLLTPTTSSRNPPPSSKRLPIIGNLHQLALPLHQNLFSLAKKYGPLMLLHLGQTPIVVVSSAEAAHEVMKTHDLAFASRHDFKINKKMFYDSKDVALAPYGDYWRKMKSILVLQLLSNKRVRSSQVAREERTKTLMEKIERSLLAELNLSELLESLIFDTVCDAAFGKTKEMGGERGERFRKLLEELMRIVGGFDIGEVIPWLSWVGRVSGKDSRVDTVAKEIDNILEDIIQEHIDRNKDGEVKHFDEEDFVDILLKTQKDDESAVPIDRDGVKAILLDVFAAGTDTTSTLLEWEMSELLKHPNVMERLQDEIRAIGKGKAFLTAEDLEKMSYLKAVVKETLRLHPSVPMPFPREARQDAKVMGYDIAAKTVVIVNLWAIGRDPKFWENPEEFQPERFIDSNIDFKGNDFQLIPFGAGRRVCPGISFAAASNEIVLANLLNKFDCKLPNGMAAEDFDMTESSTFTIHRKSPLLTIAAIPHSLT